ncbi:hypothetical protein Tchl_0156 [Thauera chlorobenzoica]|uniref:Uncharacterized protein n=1 Tax=Thauera chlorobenzoica TaxID=96773 RepID=A0A1L6F7Z3_9RHOO|nr:hypothetical protein Tchl_0156 [Thauera chlorobenzoica]
MAERNSSRSSAPGPPALQIGATAPAGSSHRPRQAPQVTRRGVSRTIGAHPEVVAPAASLP